MEPKPKVGLRSPQGRANSSGTTRVVWRRIPALKCSRLTDRRTVAADAPPPLAPPPAHLQAGLPCRGRRSEASKRSAASMPSASSPAAVQTGVCRHVPNPLPAGNSPAPLFPKTPRFWRLTAPFRPRIRTGGTDPVFDPIQSVRFGMVPCFHRSKTHAWLEPRLRLDASPVSPFDFATR